MAPDQQLEIVGRDACRLGIAPLFVALLLGGAAFAGDPPPPALFANEAAGLHLRKPVTTFKEFKERRVVKQKYDFSCGAAALATLLREFYQIPVAEEGIVAYIVRKRGQEQAVRRYKEKKGFSLLDLKMAAASIRFRCSAYSEMNLVDLVELNAPTIVPIRTRDYDHFVIFRGLKGDRVYITDPVAGNLTVKAANFVAIWRDGVGMVLKSPQGIQPTHWQPDHTAQGFYVSQDQVRSMIDPAAVAVRRGSREF